jgi:hypothetical protein
MNLNQQTVTYVVVCVWFVLHQPTACAVQYSGLSISVFALGVRRKEESSRWWCEVNYPSGLFFATDNGEIAVA